MVSTYQFLTHSLESVQLCTLKIAFKFSPSLILDISTSHSFSPLINRCIYSKLVNYSLQIYSPLLPLSSSLLKFLPHPPYPIRYYHFWNLKSQPSLPLSINRTFLLLFSFGTSWFLLLKNIPFSPAFPSNFISSTIKYHLMILLLLYWTSTILQIHNYAIEYMKWWSGVLAVLS